jgi:hypothetical protein
MVNKDMQNPSGGLNDKGRAFYNHQGHHLKAPVTKVTGPKSAARRASFCARMSGVKGPLMKNGKPTRKKLALTKWHCK